MHIQHVLGPASFPPPPITAPHCDNLSVLSYNVLLPNSVDGWWNYKMYLPPLSEEQRVWSTWDYRRELLKKRISIVDPDVVCFQEVAPISFEDDFSFMMELGYDGKEMFKKGRFRPATFWKSSKLELASPAVHKDRTLLLAFHNNNLEKKDRRTWFVLNCHLQSGKQAQRRLRQMNEGVRGVMTLARKLKEKNPEKNIPLIVCGDFNGDSECGALRFLEDGFVDETFREDGEAVTTNRKALPFESPLKDVVALVGDDIRPPPATLVVPELISTMVEGGAYENPTLSQQMLDRLNRIYDKFATHQTEHGGKVMGVQDVERWLVDINGQLGRGSEFREAARLMGWKDKGGSDSEDSNEKAKIELPKGGLLSRKSFIEVYEEELKQGKFWGIAHDMAVLNEPLPDAGVFQSRYDRMYCSAAVEPLAVMDFPCSVSCPNGDEPSDHLPVAASFIISS